MEDQKLWKDSPFPADDIRNFKVYLVNHNRQNSNSGMNDGHKMSTLAAYIHGMKGEQEALKVLNECSIIEDNNFEVAGMKIL